jgi:hypothetical protein
MPCIWKFGTCFKIHLAQARCSDQIPFCQHMHICPVKGEWVSDCFWKLFAGFMIKCLSLGGSSPWAAVQMVVDITIIRTLLFVVVTGLSLLTFMFQDAHPLLRPYFMDYSSCRKRSTGARTSSIGGPDRWKSWLHFYDLIKEMVSVSRSKCCVKGEAVINTLRSHGSISYILWSSYCFCRFSKTFFCNFDVLNCPFVVLLVCVLLWKLYCFDNLWTK